MPKLNETAVAEELPALPILSLVQLFAHFRPANSTPVDPSQYLDLVMELLVQDFLNARFYGKPHDEKFVTHILCYERLRLRREALLSRQKKAKSAASRSTNPPPLSEVPSAEPEPALQPPVNDTAPETPNEQVVAENSSAAPIAETATEVPAQSTFIPVVMNPPTKEARTSQPAERDWFEAADESMPDLPSLKNYPAIGNAS